MSLAFTLSDGDFEPNSETDDEETIEKEEEMDTTDHATEIEELEKEGEIPIEELLKSLPKEVIEKPASLSSAEESEEESKTVKHFPRYYS